MPRRAPRGPAGLLLASLLVDTGARAEECGELAIVSSRATIPFHEPADGGHVLKIETLGYMMLDREHGWGSTLAHSAIQEDVDFAQVYVDGQCLSDGSVQVRLAVAQNKIWTVGSNLEGLEGRFEQNKLRYTLPKGTWVDWSEAAHSTGLSALATPSLRLVHIEKQEPLQGDTLHDVRVAGIQEARRAVDRGGGPRMGLGDDMVEFRPIPPSMRQYLAATENDYHMPSGECEMTLLLEVHTAHFESETMVDPNGLTTQWIKLVRGGQPQNYVGFRYLNWKLPITVMMRRDRIGEFHPVGSLEVECNADQNGAMEPWLSSNMSEHSVLDTNRVLLSPELFIKVPILDGHELFVARTCVEGDIQEFIAEADRAQAILLAANQVQSTRRIFDDENGTDAVGGDDDDEDVAEDLNYVGEEAQSVRAALSKLWRANEQKRLVVSQRLGKGGNVADLLELGSREFGLKQQRAPADGIFDIKPGFADIWEISNLMRLQRERADPETDKVPAHPTVKFIDDESDDD